MNNWLRNNAHILTISFGTTIAMWAGGYVFHLPFLMMPSPVSLFYFLICLLVAGYTVAKNSQTPVVDGGKTGVFIAILNTLILASVLGSESAEGGGPSAVIWVPGSMVFCAVLVAVVSFVVAASIKKTNPPVNWLYYFSLITAAGTLLLILAGGIVTSADAGLAVPDWPNSYGYNMFLFPLSKMTGGIYYEHAHRLLGALVGLTTFELAFLVFALSDKKWLKNLAMVAAVLVVAQGVMGGLRVTGNLTTSQLSEDLAPNLYLAMVHGVTGQMFFALLVAIAAFTSTAWKEIEAVPHTKARAEQIMSKILLGMLVVQLVLGSLLRHNYSMNILMIHFVWAMLILGKSILASVRAYWGKVHPSLVKKLGGALGILVFLQVLLGVAALVGVVQSNNAGEAGTLDIIFSTAHQTTGALLLGNVVLLTIWNNRLLKQEMK